MSTHRHAIHSLLLVATVALAGAGCTGDLDDEEGGEGEGNAVDESALNQLLLGLPHFELAPPMPKTEIACDAMCPAEGQQGDQFCTYQRFTETAHFGEFVAFQPNSATLWPGNVVRGQDAKAGILTPLSAALGDVTFSVSLENLAGSPVGTMTEPSLSAFREQRNALLAQGVVGATPASLQFEMMEIHDASQLAVAVGAGLDWPGSGEIAASFDFASQKQSTKILVNFTQAYYTIDVDTKAQPSDFFAPGTTFDQVAGEVSLESPPLYVQSITYGRRVIFAVQTEESAEAIRGALEAAYGGVVTGSLSVEVEHQEALAQSQIQAFVIGGSGSSATGVIDGVDGLMQYIQDGGDYSAESPGAPIGYKLAYLDNAVTEMAFTTDYAEKQCVTNQGSMTVSLDGITHVAGGDVSGGMEVYGEVGFFYPEAGKNGASCSQQSAFASVWFLPSSSWVDVPKNGTWTPTNKPTVHIPKAAFGDGKRICLAAVLAEHDPIGGDDDLGFETRLVTWEQGWQGSHTLTLVGDGNTQMDVKMSVSID